VGLDSDVPAIISSSVSSRSVEERRLLVQTMVPWIHLAGRCLFFAGSLLLMVMEDPAAAEATPVNHTVNGTTQQVGKATAPHYSPGGIAHSAPFLPSFTHYCLLSPPSVPLLSRVPLGYLQLPPTNLTDILLPPYYPLCALLLHPRNCPLSRCNYPPTFPSATPPPPPPPTPSPLPPYYPPSTPYYPLTFGIHCLA
jgi:hypothetical protein